MPYTSTSDGLRLTLHVQPKASRLEWVGVEADSAGKRHLKIRITSPPEDGKANKALLKFLAKSLKLPLRDFSIFRGQHSRYKVVAIRGDSALLSAQIVELIRSIKGSKG